jgi:DNA polymerase type B, organellar and viral
MNIQQTNTVDVYLEPTKTSYSNSSATPPIYTNYCEKNENSKSCIWVEREDFYCDPEPVNGKKKKSVSMDNSPYLLVGFDTEFKAPDEAVTKHQIADGLAKVEVLSYQFHALSSDGDEWKGICCPPKGERMSLSEFLIFVLGSWDRNKSTGKLPTQIYLVGHFTRADIPTFKNFKDLKDTLFNIRNTFSISNGGLKIDVQFPNAPDITLSVSIRDTILLTPSSKKGLKALGELMQFPKLELKTADHGHEWLIQNMGYCRDHHWEMFKEYAITDASISMKFGKEIIDLYKANQGHAKFPVTLSSIGVDMLTKRLEKADPPIFDQLFGYESKKTKSYSKRLGYFKKTHKRVHLEQVDRFNNFATECYHGGRNEQFWFGPGFKDEWFDYDLHGAYPTAMSMIGLPLWSQMKITTDLDDFGADTLGYADVEFEFSKNVRYPVLPVRTANGIIFPLSGRSNCAAPEIHLARKLGAKLKISFGLIIPTNSEIKPFAEFTKDLVAKRNNAGSKSLRGLFWKEITNSTYGKTAQGLRPKRVYDLRDDETKQLDPSPITNAYLAAFITSSVRAVLGEMMNGLPEHRMVFSCTTDGFLTNATESEMESLEDGSLFRQFSKTRNWLTDDASVWEVKHKVLQPLGWRTRGQATLIAGDLPEGQKPLESKNIVLAKGGIHVPKSKESDALKNDYIVDLFLNRTPGEKIQVLSGVGIRDIMTFEADFVERIFSKRLGMEYDWKRAPNGVSVDHKSGHLIFSSKPWNNVNQFISVREMWDEYVAKQFICLKSISDFEKFADFAETRLLLDPDSRRYLKREDGDLMRLRQMICSAWKHGKAGMSEFFYPLTSNEFSETLQACGIKCSKADVENGRKKEFYAQRAPKTRRVLLALEKLVEHFPTLDAKEMLYSMEGEDSVILNTGASCPFVSRASHPEEATQ